MSKLPPKVFCFAIGSNVRNDRAESCPGYISNGHGPVTCGTCIHTTRRAIVSHTEDESIRWGLDYYF